MCLSPDSRGGRLGPQCSAGAGDALRDRAEQVLGHGNRNDRPLRAIQAPSPLCFVVG